VRALNDPVFRGAIAHNFAIVALSLLIQLPISLGLALLVGRKLPGRVIFRTLFSCRRCSQMWSLA
jgi:raffinose/stachyose/melibiose transport system permease protein